jgi:hypothetical protein
MAFKGTDSVLGLLAKQILRIRKITNSLSVEYDS